MKLLFQNSQGKERVIAEIDSFEEACSEMDKFMEERSFNSYYKRLWDRDGRMIVDVGSWTEFFIIEGYTLEDVYKEQDEKVDNG